METATAGWEGGQGNCASDVRGLPLAREVSPPVGCSNDCDLTASLCHHTDLFAYCATQHQVKMTSKGSIVTWDLGVRLSSQSLTEGRFVGGTCGALRMAVC